MHLFLKHSQKETERFIYKPTHEGNCLHTHYVKYIYAGDINNSKNIKNYI